MNTLSSEFKQQISQLTAALVNALNDILLPCSTQLTRKVFTEIELIRILQNKPYRLLPEYNSADSFALFQVHFILYHALYTFKLTCLSQQLAQLEIGLAKVEVLPYQQDHNLNSAQNLEQVDHLQRYYLNLQNLITTNSDDIDNMLNRFWQQINKPIVNEDDKQKALLILGVNPNATASDIKTAYKMKCLQHHPDRGGQAEAIQKINWAWQLLKT